MAEGTKPGKCLNKSREIYLKNLEKAHLKLRQLKNKKMSELSNKVTPEFAYVLGAVLGDGYIYFRPNCRGGEVRISVRDKDFAYKFYKSLKSWSGLRCRIYNYRGFWRVYSSSIIVAKILKEFEISRLKEMPREIITSFLKGLYDAEGNVHQRCIRFYNSDITLIKLVKELLEIINIKPVSIYKRDREIHNIKGREIFVKQVYTLEFGRKNNLEVFLKNIGFSIKRKQIKLKNIINSYQKTRIPWSDEELKILRNEIKNKNLTIFGSKAIICRKLSKILKRPEGSIWKKLK